MYVDVLVAEPDRQAAVAGRHQASACERRGRGAGWRVAGEGAEWRRLLLLLAAWQGVRFAGHVASLADVTTQK